MVFASIREHAEHCDFFASTSRNKKFALRACEQRKNLESTKILRAVKNFNGTFITPSYRDVAEYFLQKKKLFVFFICS